MNHRIKGRRLGRTTSHRRALTKNLVTALFTHGRVVTTEPKAKEYRPIAEKLITIGKVKTLPHIRQVVAVLGDKAAVHKLFNEIGPSFAERNGGYTRIVKLPKQRLGDKGSRAMLELVNHVPKPKAAPAEGKAGKGKRKGEEPAED